MAAPAEVNVSLAQKVQQQAAYASRSFYHYCAFVRGFVEMAWHHRAIIERVLRPEEGGIGGERELILGPPDVAKTEILIMYAEWKLGRLPSWRWLIASEVANGVAATITTAIGETIGNNERYHLTFGDLKGPAPRFWSSQRIRLRDYVSPERAFATGQPQSPPPPFPWLPARGRPTGLNHDNVRAVGWRSGFAGYRAEGIIADDLVSDRSANSQVITANVDRMMQQKLLPRLTGPGKMALVSGQTWAPNDEYARLKARGVVCFDNNPNLDGKHVLEADPDEEETR